MSGSAEGRPAGLVPSKTSVTAPAILDPADGRIEIEVDQLAQRSRRMRKSIITGARLHVEEASKGSHRGRWCMVTATYADGRDCSPRDISGLVGAFRRYFNRAGAAKRHGAMRYLWTLELTKRKRPHYHLLVWLPNGFRFPKPDKRGWWPHGMTRIEVARNAVGYLAKYASKFTAEAAAYLPKGFRTHAVGGLGDESKRELRWWKAPTDAREALGVLADIRKTLGGYADKLTGVFWPSPWRIRLGSDGRIYAWKPIA